MGYGKERSEQIKKERVGQKRINKQGYEMECIVYNSYDDIIVEFKDKYKCIRHTHWNKFLNGDVNNLYHPTICGIGIVGNRRPTVNNNTGGKSKEFEAWMSLMKRSFSKLVKDKHETYKDVTCCDEWLVYDEFYDWLHNQENFNKWYNGSRWCIDKDILKKGNKIYSPDNCCLVPSNVNSLFTKTDALRGDCPIGVHRDKECGMYIAACNVGKGKNTYIGYYCTPQDAFLAYKNVKEKYIKQIAQEEYDKGNITEQCYNAMMSYEVEITD